MWPRVLETVLGIWLLLSPFIFGYTAEHSAFWINDYVCAVLIFLFALVSFWRPLRHIHLANAGVAVWLIAFAYVMSYIVLGIEAPPAAQNSLLVGFILGMLAILPNHAERPPESWQPYLQGHKRGTSL